MLNERERAAIASLWARKVEQDRSGLSRAERHRNLEPDSAELIAPSPPALGATRLLEIGGSSGVSTIALAAAARRHLRPPGLDRDRAGAQEEAKTTLADLALADPSTSCCADAGTVLDRYADLEFVADRLREGRLHPLLRPAARWRLAPIVVADNIQSHDLWDYVRHVRARPGAESITLSVGQGLEVTRLGAAPGTV